MQSNYITGHVYEGSNQAALQGAKEKNNYTTDKWITFLQAKNVNLKIKKGEHGVSIFKGFATIDEKGKDGKIKSVSHPMGFASVFNLDQTETYEVVTIAKELKPLFA